MHKQGMLTLNSTFLECMGWDGGREEQYQENLISLPLTVLAPRTDIVESAHVWNQMSTRLELACFLLLFCSTSHLECRFLRQLFYSTIVGKYEYSLLFHSLLTDDGPLQTNN